MMYHNRNERVNQVTETTLVVGIDIAKQTQYACAVDERGRELGKTFTFKQSNQGFVQFYERLQKMMADHHKESILIGFEPTGHYWMNLAAFLTEKNIRFVTVNPMHVNRSKELDDNLQTKSDQKDARVIAKLMTAGNYNFPRVLEGVEADLREGSALRSRLKEDMASTKNRITRWLDKFFPEFPSVFKGLGQHACAILKQTPLPGDLLGQSPEDLARLYREKEGVQQPPKPKIKRLIESADHSIGLKEGTAMARIEITTLIHQLELLQRQLEDVNERLHNLAKQLTEYNHLMSIPGIGEGTIVELLAETGSLKQYNHPRQLLKLAGLTLRENSSGQQKGQKHISKRGRKKLRSLLYRAILPLIRNNQAFFDLYSYYISRRDNPLRKKEAMLVLCGKLIKICYGLSKHDAYFDAERMKQDLPCLQEAS